MRHPADDPPARAAQARLPHAGQARLRANLEGLRARIEAARRRSLHAADAVELVVVTKSVPPAVYGPLLAAGVRDVGENRVQDAVARKPHAPPGLTWHGIGHLQRNKAASALETFDVLHAVDSLRLARRLEAVLAGEPALGRRPVYLQVNAAEDPGKHGVEPDEALDLLREVLRLPHLQPVGFMTMGKLGVEDGDLRSTFRTLRGIRDEARGLGLGASPADGLSMGMSDDFEIAIEEGATVVRVGRAVFDGVEIPGSPTASNAAQGPGTSGERR